MSLDLITHLQRSALLTVSTELSIRAAISLSSCSGILTDAMSPHCFQTWSSMLPHLPDLTERWICVSVTYREPMSQSPAHLNLLTDSNSSYLSFCVDAVIPTKQVKLYPNNKPWVTKDLKQCLNNKNVAFLQGDKHRVKQYNSELRRKTRLAKLHYKNKVEEKFTTGNAREAWQGLNSMMGRAQKPALFQCSDPATFAEQLNIYYSRFDRTPPQNDWTLTSSSSITVDKRKVTSIHRNIGHRN
ncbi:uncharacterized protein LOC129701356 [Leucoraja erinacea]|uniref:uncharacterized protein LOC129701356 n=1 Tax=Leucoraja erinaceus TaxID=7782 RepID=UPI0024586DFC|nr:uncharacterized protein LOC129701356 [Leucoraja erinacea]